MSRFVDTATGDHPVAIGAAGPATFARAHQGANGVDAGAAFTVHLPPPGTLDA